MRVKYVQEIRVIKPITRNKMRYIFVCFSFAPLPTVFLRPISGERRRRKGGKKKKKTNSRGIFIFSLSQSDLKLASLYIWKKNGEPSLHIWKNGEPRCSSDCNQLPRGHISHSGCYLTFFLLIQNKDEKEMTSSSTRQEYIYGRF